VSKGPGRRRLRASSGPWHGKALHDCARAVAVHRAYGLAEFERDLMHALTGEIGSARSGGVKREVFAAGIVDGKRG
jgi:hypothetical protein